MKKLISALKDNKGFSLVEVLVSVGIGAVVMLAFSSMMANQNKETKALRETLASLDLQKTLISVLANGSVCSHLLNNPTVLTFNSTQLPQTLTPSLPIYSSLPITSSSVPLAKVGELASPLSESMVIKDISLKILNGSGNTYNAKWVVSFDSSKSVRSHRSIEVSTVLTVDNTNPAAMTVVDCMSEQVANRYLQSCPANQVMSGYTSDGYIKCQSSALAYAVQKCPSGQVLNGFNSDGSISCAAASSGSSNTTVIAGPTCTSGHMSFAGWVCNTWSR